MSRFLTLGALVVLCVAPVAVQAAEKAPAIMLRVQSIDQLLNNAEYIAALAGQEEVAKQGIGFIRALAGEKGIEGVDIKKPFGLYANLAQEIINSEVIVMLPIADKDAFLGLLKTRLSLEVKEEKGLYSTEPPNNMGTVYFRFANDYVYGTYLNKDNIAAEKLVKPADVLGKGESVLELSVRIDRIPEEMKKFALGAVEENLARGKEAPLPIDSKAVNTLREKSIDSISAGVKALLYEGEEVNLKINVDSKKDELALEFNLTAKKGSDLAKDFADLKSKKGVALGSLAARNSAAMLTINASLPPSVKKVLGPAIDDLVKLGMEQAPADAKDILEPVIKAALPTLKAGDFDGGAALVGPNAKSHYTVVLAGKVSGGKDLEKAIKDATKEAIKKDPNINNYVDFDADSVGDIKLHHVKTNDFVMDEKAKKLFGHADAWLAFRDDVAIISMGEDAKETLKTALKGTPTSGPVVKMEMSIVRLLAAAEVQDAAAAKIAAKEVFGANPSDDTFTVVVDGGDSLKVRAALKGKLIKFFVAMEKAKAN